ncbi:MAG TPA: hypothetical protein VH164_12710 [Ktedonobacteraceae bacterium]|nr:hypothetical protein [Ktedonobacteraceae bacterium]
MAADGTSGSLEETNGWSWRAYSSCRLRPLVSCAPTSASRGSHHQSHVGHRNASLVESQPDSPFPGHLAGAATAQDERSACVILCH